MFKTTLLVALVFSSIQIISGSSAPSYSGNATTSPAIPTTPMTYQTIQLATDAFNYPMFEQRAINPVGLGLIAMLQPRNNLQNPESLSPPPTNATLVSTKLQTGPWARSQEVCNLPIPSAVTSVEMRLNAGEVRELQWPNTPKRASILKNGDRVNSTNSCGKVFMETRSAGDLLCFLSGTPHSLQANSTYNDPTGAEFLQVFGSGNLTEYSTFQLTDWTARIPKTVPANRFQVNVHIPSNELFIFPYYAHNVSEVYPTRPYALIPATYTYHSNDNNTASSDTSMKTVDSRTVLVASTNVGAGALVTVEPGAMHELHRYPTQSKWSYMYSLAGKAQVNLFASGSDAQNFGYSLGDIGPFINETGSSGTTRFLN